jgi:hypothetical protein
MPNPLVTQAIGRASKRLPLLKRLPVMRLLLLGEVALLARDHIEKLTPKERRRLVVLMKDARGRPHTLPSRQRSELEALIAKAEPKLFAREAAGKVSPVPLPGRNPLRRG